MSKQLKKLLRDLLNFTTSSLLYYFGIDAAGPVAAGAAGATGAAAGAAGAVGIAAAPVAGAGAGAAGRALSITPPLTAPLPCWLEM